ncbi:hypothetical protein ACFL27_19390 [candidate division CSSED10-310 bacterium]|uniref:Uncharacterized protein n=1 Tax=candidate division CSSED10-310 bacterium TaxID=2855610 RepID=A0ABV6Z1P6_UNCC1
MQRDISNEFETTFPLLAVDKKKLDGQLLEILPAASGTNAVVLTKIRALWLNHYERFYPLLWTQFCASLTKATPPIFKVGLFIDVMARVLWILSVSDQDKAALQGDNSWKAVEPWLRILVVDGLFTLLLEEVTRAWATDEAAATTTRFMHHYLVSEDYFADYQKAGSAANESARAESVFDHRSYHRKMVALLQTGIHVLFPDYPQPGRFLKHYLSEVTHRLEPEEQPQSKEVSDPALEVESDDYPGIKECFGRMNMYLNWLLSNGLIQSSAKC